MKTYGSILSLLLLIGCSENTVTRSNKVYLAPVCLTQSQTYLNLKKESPQTTILANSDCSEMIMYTPNILVEVSAEPVNVQKDCPATPAITQPTPPPVTTQNPQVDNKDQKPDPKKSIKETQIIVAHMLIRNNMNKSQSYHVQLADEFPYSKIHLSEITDGYEFENIPSDISYKSRKDRPVSQKNLETGKGLALTLNSKTLCAQANKSAYINTKIDELLGTIQINHIYNYGKFKISTPIESLSVEIKDPAKPAPVRTTGPL